MTRIFGQHRVARRQHASWSRTSVRPRLEPLEDRWVPSSLVPVAQRFSMTEGTNQSALVGTFADTNTATASNFTASIIWGDGTAASAGAVSQLGPHSFGVVGTHNYAEEAGAGFPFSVVITVHDNITNDTTLIQSSATVLDAVLSPNKITTANPLQFNAVGTAGSTNALSAFEAAIGGPNNKDNPPQPNGFRTINWDGVKLDGTDFNGDTTVINKGTTVAIPVNRFQSRGVQFEEVYAVSGDGFATVNPHAKGLFPAFSPKNTFTMFNENTIDFRFVLASDPATDPRPAISRGFGAIFLNVRLPDTTSIEYFNGDTSLGKFFVTPGPVSSPEFLGVLFNNPVVTRVTITLGTDVLFFFDGTTFHSSSTDNPGAGHNLAVTDDFAYAEPMPLPPPPPPRMISPKAGVAFTGVVATFFDSDPKGNAKDFTATISWGDGHQSPGAITVNPSGGFNVSGTNTYAHPGVFHITVAIADFGGSGLTLPATANVGMVAAGTIDAINTAAPTVPAAQNQPVTPVSQLPYQPHRVDAALSGSTDDATGIGQLSGNDGRYAVDLLTRHARSMLDSAIFVPKTEGADVDKTLVAS
jgi:hypothetical protein